MNHCSDYKGRLGVYTRNILFGFVKNRSGFTKRNLLMPTPSLGNRAVNKSDLVPTVRTSSRLCESSISCDRISKNSLSFMD